MQLTFSPGARSELKALVFAAVPEACEGEGGLRVVDLATLVDVSAVGPSDLVLCDGAGAERLAQLWGEQRLHHLLLIEAPRVELSAVLRRMAAPGTHGYADLLGPTERRHVWPVHDSSERPALLAELRQRSGASGATKRSVERLISIAEELVTNALYNAPLDDAGQPLHAHKPRTERVLVDRAAVRVELADDDERVALVVRDHFGSLAASTTFENLARCLRAGSDQVVEKAGGAGIGLFTVLSASNHLVITVAPGQTEIVAIVDKRVSRPTGRCFSWFELPRTLSSDSGPG